MRVLVVTNMYPTKDKPAYGIFVQEQVEALRKEGVEIDVFFVDGSRNKLNYIWGIFRLWGRLLTRRYDLIHAHYVFSGIIARAQLLYPVVLTHHGFEVFMTWERFPSRLITHLVDKVILVSEDQKKRDDVKLAIMPSAANPPHRSASHCPGRSRPGSRWPSRLEHHRRSRRRAARRGASARRRASRPTAPSPPAPW